MLFQYFGTPASWKSLASIQHVIVVISEGFTTTVLPAISAGAIYHKILVGTHVHRLTGH